MLDTSWGLDSGTSGSKGELIIRLMGVSVGGASRHSAGAPPEDLSEETNELQPRC